MSATANTWVTAALATMAISDGAPWIANIYLVMIALVNLINTGFRFSGEKDGVQIVWPTADLINVSLWWGILMLIHEYRLAGLSNEEIYWILSIALIAMWAKWAVTAIKTSLEIVISKLSERYK